MASWCTEPNQSAMISPIMRSALQGIFRGEVSITNCMQSTWLHISNGSSMLPTGPTALCPQSCPPFRAFSLASTTGRRCFIKVVAARWPPVAIRATRLFSTLFSNYALSINLRLEISWRDSKHFRSKDDRLRKFQCGGIKFVVLGWHYQVAAGEKETNLQRSAPKKMRQFARVMTRLTIGKMRTWEEPGLQYW